MYRHNSENNVVPEIKKKKYVRNGTKSGIFTLLWLIVPFLISRLLWQIDCLSADRIECGRLLEWMLAPDILSRSDYSQSVGTASYLMITGALWRSMPSYSSIGRERKVVWNSFKRYRTDIARVVDIQLFRTFQKAVPRMNEKFNKINSFFF